MNYLLFLFVLHLIALMAFEVGAVRPLSSNETWTSCNETIGQISMNNLCKRLLLCYQSTANGTSKLRRQFRPGKLSTNGNGQFDECAKVMEGKGWHGLIIASDNDGNISFNSSLGVDGIFSINQMETETTISIDKDYQSLAKEFQNAMPFGAFLEDYGRINLEMALLPFLCSSASRLCKSKCIEPLSLKTTKTVELSTATFGQLSTATFGQLSTATFGQLSTATFGQLSTAVSGKMSIFGQHANANRRKNEKEFMIQFKNIRLNYRTEFASPCPANTKLFILTIARRDGFEKRQIVRQTWINDSIPGEVIRFFIADKSQSEANGIQQKLEEEQAKYGDLVFLSGFVDQYKHLHLKVYAGYQWQQSFCADAEWILKADDDAVIHLRRLAHWCDIKFRPIVAHHPLVYFGIVLYGQTPHREPGSKWYLSEVEYPLDRFPNFASGSIYLTTPATTRAILSHAREVDAIFLEDVLFTGILAQLANVTLSDQNNHFIWSYSDLDERNAKCENGTPTAFSMFGFNARNEYEYQYGRLKTAVCSRDVPSRTKSDSN